MSKQQILEKAIRKVSDNGLRVDWTAKGTFRVWSDRQYVLEDGSAGIDIDAKEYSLSSPKEFIFNHDFAKELFGEDKICKLGHAMGGGDIYCHYDDGSGAVNSECACEAIALSSYQYHLQQMVIADDPIKYLGENLGA